MPEFYVKKNLKYGNADWNRSVLCSYHGKYRSAHWLDSGHVYDVERNHDDEFDFTGRNLISASFNGTPIAATVWADFVEIVCKSIPDMDLSGMVQTTEGAARFGLESFLYVSEVDHSRKISESIYLRTDCDTNREIWFLGHFFTALGIDKDSLIMSIGLSATFIWLRNQSYFNSIFLSEAD